MSEYAKKLHINYNGTQTDIKLYTTTNDVGSNYLSINDGISNTYAKLDTASGTNLHIRKNGTVYNVIKEARLVLPKNCINYMERYYSSTYNTITILPDELQNADASNVTIMYNMFGNCKKLTNIPLLDTSNVTDMSYIFAYCESLTNIPLLNTYNVTNMTGMFANCTSLIAIPSLLNTSKTTNMDGMFAHCSSLKTIPNINTSNVTNMDGMLNECTSLITIPQLDTSKVTNISWMFFGCKSLTTIPQLDTYKATNMSYMFSNCTSLPTVFPWIIDCVSITTIDNISSIFYYSSVKEVTFKNVKSSIKSQFTANNLGIQLTKITIQNTI